MTHFLSLMKNWFLLTSQFLSPSHFPLQSTLHSPLSYKQWLIHPPSTIFSPRSLSFVPHPFYLSLLTQNHRFQGLQKIQTSRYSSILTFKPLLSKRPLLLCGSRNQISLLKSTDKISSPHPLTIRRMQTVCYGMVL